jgi:hypothetical protein
MALLAKHLRHMGHPNFAEAQSGGVLRTEAKYAAPWAVSADGTAGKTYDQHGLRRVRVEHSEYVIENRRVVAEVVRKVGDVLTRELYLYPKFGVCGVIDARINGSRWDILLAVGDEEHWVPIADCRGFGGVVSFKPGRSEGSRTDRQALIIRSRGNASTRRWGTQVKK